MPRVIFWCCIASAGWLETIQTRNETSLNSSLPRPAHAYALESQSLEIAISIAIEFERERVHVHLSLVNQTA